MARGTENEGLPVKEAREGSPEAWEHLFKRYQLPLYTYVRELVGDEQVSLDIVQETFINATRHLASLREDGKFGSWLFSIAHQKCIHVWRRKDRDRVVDAEEPWNELEDLEAPDNILIRQEDEAAFLELLGRLAPIHRSVLLLHFIEQFPLAEIAVIAGVGVGTVKSRLHYAKSALRHLVSQKL